MALGARRTTIHRLILGEGMSATLAGLAGGIAMAIAAGRVLESLLYEVSPAEPAVLAAVAVVLASAAAAACYVPARRATSGDPSLALRQE
jgi:putative ABC transport system permease protein